MANRFERYDDNKPGQFYVDESCIHCLLCSEIAPDVFRISESQDHNIVYHQPVSDEELRSAAEAMDSCPTESIGDDGESATLGGAQQGEAKLQKKVIEESKACD